MKKNQKTSQPKGSEIACYIVNAEGGRKLVKLSQIAHRIIQPHP